MTLIELIVKAFREAIGENILNKKVDQVLANQESLAVFLGQQPMRHDEFDDELVRIIEGLERLGKR